jgi:hypothetical protein
VTLPERLLRDIPVGLLKETRDEIVRRYAIPAEYYFKNLTRIRNRRLLGRLIQANVEDALLEVAERYPEVYSAAMSNRKRSHGFALVEGSSTNLTALTLRSLSAKPSPAEYRRLLGSQLNGLNPQPPAPDKLDAILIHVPPRKIYTRPAALVIRFFDGPDFYHSDAIDLFALESGASIIHLPRVRLERIDRETTFRVKREDEISGPDDDV